MTPFTTKHPARYRNLPCSCINARVVMLMPDCPLCHGEGVYPQVVEVGPTNKGLSYLVIDICKGGVLNMGRSLSVLGIDIPNTSPCFMGVCND